MSCIIEGNSFPEIANYHETTTLQIYILLCLNFSYQYTYNHAIDYRRKKIKLIGILNVFKHVLKFNSDSYFFSNLTLPLVDSTVAMTTGKIYIGFMHTQDTHSQRGLDNNSIISS